MKMISPSMYISEVVPLLQSGSDSTEVGELFAAATDIRAEMARSATLIAISLLEKVG